MRIDILTLFPRMFAGFLDDSILKRAQTKGLAQIILHDLRDFSENKHRNCDDTPFGGGAGMVMTPQPIVNAIESLKLQRHYDEIIFLTPDGEQLNQALVNTLSMSQNLIMLCGRYKGIDQRVRDRWITREISIGDYVLTGGELPAAVLVDSIVRLIPGVLGDETSALLDSYQGGLLDAPQYTKPAEFMGISVPNVLLGGNHAAIDAWRDEQAYRKTKELRPDLLGE